MVEHGTASWKPPTAGPAIPTSHPRRHGPEQLPYKLEEVRVAEALLIGRVTCESLAGTWPQRTAGLADERMLFV